MIPVACNRHDTPMAQDASAATSGSLALNSSIVQANPQDYEMLSGQLKA